MSFKIKRAYEKATADDGQRVLVDRLWPRGLSRANAKLTVWMKEIAPTPDLRKWFDHDPARFVEFKRRYGLELAKNPALSELRSLGKKDVVTLVYGARDPEVNHANVLLDALRRA
jgi:uncharacterized protein YeaO (DUF488 family)